MSAFLVVLRVLTTITAFFVCIAPLPDFWRIHKTRRTGEVSILPVVMLFANCYVWVLYAYQVNNIFPLFVMTILGMLSSLGFGSIYYRWSKERVYIRQLCGGMGLFLAAYTLYYVLGTSGVTNQSENGVEKTLGFICVAVNLVLYASPLETMKRVIQTKNASSLPISISVVFLVNAVLWVTFAIADDDLFVLVPNAIGTALCLVQVVLFLIYRREPQRGEVNSVGLAKDERPVADASSCEDVAIQMSPVYEALRSPVGVKALS
ncbi:hypothetical protein BBJ28_00015427 [Nothophytophthora sp. Chile5]|nr:hypothetical protein BBJ28_00015427 [Nothophytophthora sp. Chile5]